MHTHHNHVAELKRDRSRKVSITLLPGTRELSFSRIFCIAPLLSPRSCLLRIGTDYNHCFGVVFAQRVALTTLMTLAHYYAGYRCFLLINMIVLMSFARFLHRNVVSHPLPSLSSLIPKPRAARCTRSQTTPSIAVNKFRTSDGVHAALFFKALPSKLRSSSHSAFYAKIQQLFEGPYYYY